MSIRRIGAGARMSKAVVHGNTVYLAGQVADKSKGASVAEQTKEIVGIIDELLKEAGSDKTKILSATIYLSDISTFAQMNSVWDTWVVAGHTPARATVEAKLAAPGIDVEIMVEAAIEGAAEAGGGKGAAKKAGAAKQGGAANWSPEERAARRAKRAARKAGK